MKIERLDTVYRVELDDFMDDNDLVLVIETWIDFKGGKQTKYCVKHKIQRLCLWVPGTSSWNLDRVITENG